MKKIFTKSILATAILLVGLLNGCISDPCTGGGEEINPNNPNIGETQAVTIRIVNPNNAATRSASAYVPDGYPVEINTGRIFLVNAATGQIWRYHRIETLGGSYESEGGYRFIQGGNGSIIRRSWLKEGVIIPSVPSVVTRIVIVGNYTYPGAGSLFVSYSGLSALPTSGNISQLWETNRHLNINSQWNERNVSVFADEILQDTGDTVPFRNREYRVFNTIDGEPLLLEPKVARFEINRIMSAGDITSFRVEGIFMDGFYSRSQLRPDNITNFINATQFTYSVAPFNTDDRNAIHSWFTGGINSQVVNYRNVVTARIAQPALPAGEWRFGYQVFADEYYFYETGFTPDPANVAPPRIIIRFSQVTLANGTIIDDTRFLTINSFRPIAGFTNTIDICNDGYLTHIRPSRVYRIDDIEFSYSDLSPRPNDNPINVNIRVDVGAWSGTTFRPNQALWAPTPQPQVVCTPVDFNLPPAMGGSWDFEYQWQRRPIGGGTITDLATTVTLPANQVLIGYEFRRRVSDNAGATWLPAADAVWASVTEPLRDYTFPLYVEIDGVKWATRNVDLRNPHPDPDFEGFAYHPADPGMLFQWGRDRGWYAGTAIRWWNGTSWTYGGWESTDYQGTSWNSGQGVCPDGWRLPTIEEFEALRTYSPGADINAGRWLTDIQAAEQGFGCKAGRVLGVSAVVSGAWDFNPDTEIFLPASGMRHWNGGALQPGLPTGFFWTHSRHPDSNIFNSRALRTNSGETHTDIPDYWHRHGWAFSVRCVKGATGRAFSQPNYTRRNPRGICPNECVIDDLGPAYWVDTQTPMVIGTEVTYRWEMLNINTGVWSEAPGAYSNLTYNLNTWNLPAYFRRIATSVDYGTSHTSNILRVYEVPRRTPYPGFFARPIVGVYWATHNINLSRINYNRVTAHPSDGGMFFQWGRHYGFESRPSAGATELPERRWNPTLAGGAGGWDQINSVVWNTTAVLTTVGANHWNPVQDPCRIKGDGWRLATRENHDALLALAPAFNYWLTAIEVAEELGYGCMPGRVFRNPNNPTTDWVFFPATGYLNRFTGAQGGIWGRARAAHYGNSYAQGTAGTSQYQARMQAIFDATIWMAHGHRTIATAIRCVRETATFSQENPSDRNIGRGQTYTFNLPIATGGTGAITYNWQRSTDGGATWENAPGVRNQATYTTPALNRTTHFRRQAISGGVTINSAPAKLRVWYDRNVGAAQPQNAGNHFQWNRSTAFPSTGTTPPGWLDNAAATGTTWATANDPCPHGWRIPTIVELESLLTPHAWTTNWNGTGARGLVHGTAPNQIFLPITGWRLEEGTLNTTDNGWYWSSGATANTGDNALRFVFDANGQVFMVRNTGNRLSGHSIRCVSDTSVPPSGGGGGGGISGVPFD